MCPLWPIVISDYRIRLIMLATLFLLISFVPNIVRYYGALLHCVHLVLSEVQGSLEEHVRCFSAPPPRPFFSGKEILKESSGDPWQLPWYLLPVDI